MAETTKIIIEAEDNASKVFKKFENQLDDTKKQTENIADSFKKVGAAFLALGTAGAFGIKQLVDAAADFEQTKVAFTTMTGSAENAQKVLGDLATFAANTPFNLTGIQTAAKQLLAYGIAQDDLIPQLKTLGDVAAGVGMDKFPQLILAFGQVKAATKLTGSELRQFSEAGVPLLGTLADQFGVTAGQMQKMISDGAVGFPAVQKAFETLTGEGGRFQNLMENQSKTFAGQFSNLQDNFDQLKIALGAPLLEPLKKVNDILLKITTTIKDFTKEHPQIASLVAQLALLATTFLIVVGSLGLLMGMKATFIAGFLAMKTVVMAIGAALLSPWTLVIIAIGLVVAAIVWLVKNWDMVKAKAIEVFGFIGTFLSGIWNSITTTITAVWNGIVAFFSFIWTAIQNTFIFFANLIVGLVVGIFNLFGIDIVGIFTGIFDGFVNFWKTVGEAWEISTGMLSEKWNSFWGKVSTKATEKTSEIKIKVTEFWEGVKKGWEIVRPTLEKSWEDTWNTMKGALESVGNAMWNIWKGVANLIIGAINSIIHGINSIAEKGASITGMDIKTIPEIPKLAKGGIVTKPTLAMIGEAGAEAVVPLSGGNRPGLGNITINITGSFMSGEAAEKMADEVIRQLKLYGAVV